MEIKSVGTFKTTTVKLATFPLFSKTSRVMSLFFWAHSSAVGMGKGERGGGEVEGMIPLKPIK